MADATPLTGWPALPLRHMQRPSATGGWVAVPARAAPVPRQGVQEGEEEEDGEEEEEEVLDEKQIAKVDPLLGLLRMDLLPRAAFVLGKARAPGAIAPLLCLLIRWVRLFWVGAGVTGGWLWRCHWAGRLAARATVFLCRRRPPAASGGASAWKP